MDKRAEKEIEIEIKLTPESEKLSSEEPLPELVTPTSELPDQVAECSPKESQPLTASTNPAIDRKTDGQAGADKKVAHMSPWFKRRKYRAVFVVVSLVLLAGCASYFSQWYGSAPRHSRPMTMFMVPTILSSWVGDPDTAYTLQLLPELMVTERDEKGMTPSQHDIHEKLSTIGFDDMRHFLEQSKGADRPMSTFTECVMLSRAGKTAEAARLFRPLLEKYSSPLLNLYQGIFLTLDGQMHDALVQFDKGMALANAGRGSIHSTSFYYFWIMKAATLQSMGKPAEALSVLESPELLERIKSAPVDTLAPSKASVYLQLGQPDKAIVTACQMKKLDRFILSAAYLMKGDYDEALTHSKGSDLALSRYYSSLGKLEVALNHAESADKSLDTVVTREQRVYVLNQMGHYKEALALCQEMDKYSHFRTLEGAWQAIPVLHADRAYAYAKSGDAKNALAEANEVLKNNPFSYTALEASRLASAKLGDKVNEELYSKRINELKNKSDYRPLPFSYTYYSKS